MFSLDGEFRKGLKYQLPNAPQLDENQKELLFYVTCFSLADQKLSCEQIIEKGQEVANRVLNFYLQFKEPLDKFYSAKKSDFESNFVIANTIFKMMKKREQADALADVRLDSSQCES